MRIDPQTNEVVATIPLDGLTGYDAEIVIGAGSVWVVGVNYSENAERDVAERGASGGLVMTPFRG